MLVDIHQIVKTGLDLVGKRPEPGLIDGIQGAQKALGFVHHLQKLPVLLCEHINGVPRWNVLRPALVDMTIENLAVNVAKPQHLRLRKPFTDQFLLHLHHLPVGNLL